MKPQSLPYFQSIARRLYRIFSHAFFHHRDVFTSFEAECHLCERFTEFVSRFRLISKEQLIVPASGFVRTGPHVAGGGKAAGAH